MNDMGRVLPPEVVLDKHGRQVLAPGFYRYEPCAEGCGYLIGCGDAVDLIAHESCDRLARERERTHVHDFDNHDERCCMMGAWPGWGPHQDCPGRCRCGEWPLSAPASPPSDGAA